MMILSWLYTIRSYISAYGSHLRYRWLLSLVWALAIAGMIWFYGAQLSFGSWRPFAEFRVRLAAVILILVIYVGLLVYRLVAARRADAKLIDAVTDDKDSPARLAAADVAELRVRLKDALKTLRRTMGRGAIYQLPWYLLIGAPGAGKTSALINSGLHFPLAEGGGPQSLQGVAGTRHCDWWFTDQGILIDTAGRYTAQDGEQEADKAGWKGFLTLLRRFRRRQPLNGAIVVIGLDDIMNADSAERIKQGRVIRKRLRELDEAFKLRVPAYIVLTKADRLAGFSAFFENLDRSSREQVWGVTLPLPSSGTEGGDLADRFGYAIDALVERLNALMLDRLQTEQDGERRCEVFAFPSQVALIAEPLHEMLGEMAAASRFDPPPRIRGIYLASAQQDEAPLDLVTRAAVAHFGVELPRLAEATIPGSKSFFLARLINEVIFGEASLISTDPRRERRNRILRWSGSAAISLAALALAVTWGVDYFRQTDRLASVEARLALYSPAAAAIPIKNVSDRDFARISQMLDVTRDIATPYDHDNPGRLTLPSQADKVLSGHRDLYRRALNDFLLPRLLIQVEADMRGDPATNAWVGDNVRVYPMLGGRTRMDTGFARKTLDADLERALPGAGSTAVRAALAGHIAALVAAPLTPIALDDRLIGDAMTKERAREQLAAWDSEGGALCRSTVGESYPFVKTAGRDMTRDEFTAIFGPQGAFAAFFAKHLAGKVDTSVSPWRWNKDADPHRNPAEASHMPGKRVVPDQSDGLAQFERAAAIRAAFFGGLDPDAMQVAFSVTPLSLEGDAIGVTLQSDGQQVSSSQGVRSGQPVMLAWPGGLGTLGAELSFQPAGAGSGTIARRGLWAIFHVLDSAGGNSVDADGVRATFTAPHRSAVFLLHVDTAFDPFDLKSLRQFHCPRAL